VGPDGSLYIADQVDQRIRKVTPDGIINTVVGSGPAPSYGNGFAGDGGAATEARLSNPHGITVGPDGSLYVVDASNARIRRVGPDGIITTVVGGGGEPPNEGGPATAAALSFVAGTAVAPDGSLYIVEVDGHRIRRIQPTMPGIGLGEGQTVIPS